MSSSESLEALSDPLPRIYSCFCDKIFTTYPGIYLHLKSKHANLFQKYKKLKITKLFKKVKGENNTEVFKLDKLNEKEINNSNFYLKKIKQNNKKFNTNCEENIVFLEVESDEERKKKPPNFPFNGPLDQRPQEQNINRPYPQTHRDIFERMGGNSYYPPMHNPFFSLPYYPPHAFPPYPLGPPLGEPTIKILLQDFLSFASNPINSKIELRDTLYKLMIHIDQNYASISDPRANREMILLSYCDIFSAKFIGQFLNNYILQRAANITENETANSAIVAQVDYLKQFAAFLRERRLIFIENDPKPQPPLQIEIITTSKAKDIQLMEKCQMVHD